MMGAGQMEDQLECQELLLSNLFFVRLEDGELCFIRTRIGE
jgi:hypothetical protein